MNDWVLLLVVALPLIALWIRAGVEVIRRRDSSSVTRFGWLAALVLLPVLGLAAYIVTRTPPRSSRSGGDADSNPGEQIVLLAEARQRGELDTEEFRRQIRSLGLHRPGSGQTPA